MTDGVVVVLVSEFDFALPQELIAQEPPAVRGNSRMLLLDRATGAWADASFASFPDQLRAGDVLVLNDSRVVPARLYGTRVARAGQHAAAGGRIEVLLTEQIDAWEWRALGKPGRKLRVGDAVEFSSAAGGVSLRAEIVSAGERGERTLRFAPVADFAARLDVVGHMPLPPYIHRQDDARDRERYQTVYAAQWGSAAAPTAGLHFTPDILAEIRARGVEVCAVTLHVGLGTFQPARAERTEAIMLHSERYTLPEETACAVNAALREGRRVVAAGTTTVRTLEHCAAVSDGVIVPHAGSTAVFIAPGHCFRVVGALLTNFHLPQSTLLMLVSAFAGRQATLAAYQHAVAQRYRFFSYGDCMFIS
jgi:S-adenosylmethionine:tRNA ribosyltransferase-isomerase